MVPSSDEQNVGWSERESAHFSTRQLPKYENTNIPATVGPVSTEIHSFTHTSLNNKHQTSNNQLSIDSNKLAWWGTCGKTNTNKKQYRPTDVANNIKFKWQTQHTTNKDITPEWLIRTITSLCRLQEQDKNSETTSLSGHHHSRLHSSATVSLVFSVSSMSWLVVSNVFFSTIVLVFFLFCSYFFIVSRVLSDACFSTDQQLSALWSSLPRLKHLIFFSSVW
jgi:hypothetical protein